MNEGMRPLKLLNPAEVAKANQLSTHDDAAHMAAGHVAWRIEMDLTTGHIHALKKLEGRPFCAGRMFEPFPNRRVVDIWGPDDEDEIRRHVKRQRDKFLSGLEGVDRGRAEERKIAAETMCAECGILGGHLTVCSEYGR